MCHNAFRMKSNISIVPNNSNSIIKTIRKRCFHPIRLDTLEFITLFYLIIPWLVFIYGWLKPSLAFPIGILCMGYLAWEFPAGRHGLKFKILSPQVALILIALIWWAVSGVGGYGWQTSDWYQHNFKMRALIIHEWPVYLSKVPAASNNTTLVYPIAFYLPSAGIARLIGWKAGNLYLIIQTIVGFALTLFWFHRILGRKGPLTALLFPFLGGLDWIGRLLLTGKINFPGHIEWWAGLRSCLQLTGNGALSDYVPQHAIAGWITAAFLFYGCETKRSSSRLILIYALSLLWSPFVTIGLTPLLLLALFRSRRKELFHISNTVVAPVLGCLGVIYLMANQFTSPAKAFHVFKEMATIKLYLLFCFLEFGAYALACRPSLKTKIPNTRAWWRMSLLCLLIFPMFRYGDFNDLLMRGSIPVLFIFWLFLIDNVLSIQTIRIRNLILVGLLCIGSISSLIELSRSPFLSYGPWTKPYIQKKNQFNLDPQYFGDPNSIFFRYLASRKHDA